MLTEHYKSKNFGSVSIFNWIYPFKIHWQYPHMLVEKETFYSVFSLLLLHSIVYECYCCCCFYYYSMDASRLLALTDNLMRLCTFFAPICEHFFLIFYLFLLPVLLLLRVLACNSYLFHCVYTRFFFSFILLLLILFFRFDFNSYNGVSSYMKRSHLYLSVYTRCVF